MFRILFALLMIQFGLAGSALAEPSKLTGEVLRRAVSGKTVHIETPVGSFPIRYKGNGTMTGQAPVLVVTMGNDSGKWWVVDDRLCQRWLRWLDAKQYCFNLQRVGAAVHWLRDDGLTGTATIARQ